MTVTEVHLFNVARGEPEPAELRDAITEQQLADWEGEMGAGNCSRRCSVLGAAGVARRPSLAAKPALGLAQESRDTPGDAGQSGLQHRLRWPDPRHDDRRYDNEADAG